jgi:hypothetical protein
MTRCRLLLIPMLLIPAGCTDPSSCPYWPDTRPYTLAVTAAAECSLPVRDFTFRIRDISTDDHNETRGDNIANGRGVLIRFVSEENDSNSTRLTGNLRIETQYGSYEIRAEGSIAAIASNGSVLDGTYDATIRLGDKTCASRRHQWTLVPAES